MKIDKEFQVDKYDRAVAYLTEHPEEIQEAWANPIRHEAGCIFGYAAGPDRKMIHYIGCLTQIKGGLFRAETEALTEAIRADVRIPDRFDITVLNLPVFAEWQRRLDVELNRT